MHYLEAVLSILMNFCYDICGNYWIAIFIFTLVSKVVLLPLSLWCQKNSIILVKLMPLVNRVKIQYFGDKDEIAERQHALQKQEHYHPLLSLIPLIVQIFILMGLIAVIHKITDSGECIDLGKIPVKDGGLTWLYPLIAGFSAWLLGWAQNQIHPLQHEQSKWSQRCPNWISILISLFLGVYVAAGVIFYWICSNILSIPVQLVCNLIMPPKKYINYDELKKSKAELEKLEKLGEKVITKEMKQREKADYKRFFSIANKHLVFYSEASGFYKYFQNTIQYLLSHSNVIIHYVTNDPNDVIFEVAKERVELLQNNAEKKNVTLNLYGEDTFVLSNRGMLIELLDNLIQNAIRYNVPGGKVDVEVKSKDTGAILLVKDTGIGIPESDKDRVFERFYRVDKSRSRDTGGTGLGLAIVKHIVELHGGKIELESKLGEGTTVKIVF